MKVSQVVRAWSSILRGRAPSLSIEVTRECPLHCPGCYAYDDNHLGGGATLRQLRDFKGQQLVDGILDLVRRHKPLHVSLVGGDPLVRHKEMEEVVAALTGRGINVQVVTSAFRPIPAAWATTPLLDVVVSIDGLAAEHDVRRTPATYDRILKNIAGQRMTVHCTITGQMMKRPGYLDEFLRFWTPLAEIKRIWFSLFTPQRGDRLPEILTREERERVVSELLELRPRYPKLAMGPGTLRQFLSPPSSPEECVFARTTSTISADLTTSIHPCQFGGDPDCSSCGCMASAGLAAVAAHKLGGVIPLAPLFKASLWAGGKPPVRKQDFPILGQSRESL